LSRRGAVLLEVLVALAILSIAGLSLVTFLDAGLANERDAVIRERELADEDRLLAALTLLKRSDLDQRLGRHPLGDFVVDIARPERTLYRIALSRGESPQAEELVTVIYRAEAR